ncbi:MAG: type II toxin-antitoxin system death-on-curing family toxin [Planctomycetota bacterium]
MGAPYFLSLDQVLRIHAQMVEHYGGARGVRDLGLLQSAVAMPQASYGGQVLHPTVFDQAAAYLYHLVQNHPFHDGNKRIGAAAALVFLAMNDITAVGDEDGLVDLTMAVASGTTGKEAIAEWFRSHVE